MHNQIAPFKTIYTTNYLYYTSYIFFVAFSFYNPTMYVLYYFHTIYMILLVSCHYIRSVELGGWWGSKTPVCISNPLINGFRIGGNMRNGIINSMCWNLIIRDITWVLPNCAFVQLICHYIYGVEGLKCRAMLLYRLARAGGCIKWITLLHR